MTVTVSYNIINTNIINTDKTEGAFELICNLSASNDIFIIAVCHWTAVSEEYSLHVASLWQNFEWEVKLVSIIVASFYWWWSIDKCNNYTWWMLPKYQSIIFWKYRTRNSRKRLKIHTFCKAAKRAPEIFRPLFNNVAQSP